MRKAERDVDPLAWWKEKESTGRLGKTISMLARYCFSIPGSSAMLERAFSRVGRAMGPKRASPSTEHAERHLFVQENVARDLF